MPVATPDPDPERGDQARPLVDPPRPDHAPRRGEGSATSGHGSHDGDRGGSDGSGFPEFYRASAPRLVAFLRWQGAPLPDATDCAQEALTLCFQRWPELTHPYPWCRTTAGRFYARRVAAVQQEQPTDDPDSAGTPLLRPDTDLAAVEQRHTVLAVIDPLPLRQRQVLAWTYDGATTAEIAEALQISCDNVRSHLRHARAALRARRDELGVDR